MNGTSQLLMSKSVSALRLCGGRDGLITDGLCWNLILTQMLLVACHLLHIDFPKNLQTLLASQGEQF